MGQLNYDVLYKTDEPVDQVEAWLDAHCEGAWKLEIESPAQFSHKKNLKVLFERESDITKLCQLASQARGSEAA